MLLCRKRHNVVEGISKLRTWTKLDNVERILSRTGGKPLDAVLHTDRDKAEYRAGLFTYYDLALVASQVFLCRGGHCSNGKRWQVDAGRGQR
jgi:hypothetical protein